MKKHNTIKIVLGTILICVLLTWILPAATFSSEFTDQGRIQMGLFDLFNYPLTAISYFGYISFYMIVVGGFYGILYKIPAYRNMLDNMANCFKKHGIVFISIVMILFAVLTSICGLNLGLILFFPLIASIILLMGYDKIVVALTLVGSTMVGIIGSTFAYNNLSLLSSYLGGNFTDNVPLKFAILIACLFLLILNTILYIKRKNIITKQAVIINEVVGNKDAESNSDNIVEKVEKIEKPIKTTKSTSKSTSKKTTTTKSTDTKKSTAKSSNVSKKKTKSTNKKSTSKSNNKAAILDDEVIIAKNVDQKEEYLVPKAVSSKTKSWPILLGFVILLIVMTLAFIPWTDVFNITAMEDAAEIVNGFQIFKFNLFAKLLGYYNPFGSWLITDMIFPMAFVVFLLVFIYGIKLNDVIDGFISGAKKALAPASITLLIYTILIINTYHPFQLTIYKAILGTGSSLNIVTSSITAFLSSLLNVESAYTFQASIPYLTSLVTNTDVYPIIWIIYQAMYGFTMIFAPTSVVLMSVLSYLGVSYKEWMKAIWKFLIELLVVLLIIFTILILL